MPEREPANPPDAESFLPDFCAIPTVFTVVIVGQLLAFVLVLTPTGAARGMWKDLALTSLFVQWVGLTSTGLLCLARARLARLGVAAVGAVSFVLILVVTALLTEAAYWLIQYRVVAVELAAAWQLSEPAFWLSQQSVVDLSMSTAWHLDFLVRNIAISAIVGAVALRYFYVQFQWKKNLESEATARIQALQSRIRPHFLFNSMNTIASFTRSKPAIAEQVVEDLADLFRVSLGDARVPIPLARELELCRHYLRIEQLRLGERLRAEWDLADLPENALLPALCLQPLLENAIYHGIEPAPEGGTVRITGERDRERVTIRIANSVSGDTAARERPGNRMAQDNVRQRLRAFFGPAGTLEVESDGDVYRIGITFPVITQAP